MDKNALANQYMQARMRGFEDTTMQRSAPPHPHSPLTLPQQSRVQSVAKNPSLLLFGLLSASHSWRDEIEVPEGISLYVLCPQGLQSNQRDLYEHIKAIEWRFEVDKCEA